MTILDEVEFLLGRRPDWWSLNWDSCNGGRFTFGAWEENPLTMKQLKKLDEAYNVESIHSVSDGRTGAKLIVEVNEI